MELLGDVGHVESQFFPFGDSVSVGARWVHCLRQTYHRLRHHFGCNRSYHKLTGLKWKVVSVLSDIVLIMMQDRSTVCIEHTIGAEIVLDTLDGTPRRRGSFGLSPLSVWRQC